MALRTFVDSTGQEWQAYDVVPREEERRRYDRRSGEVQLEEVEDRREQDRRLTVGGRERIPAKSWLTFEMATERRRLSPIPEDWYRANDAQLEAYCRAARPVRASVSFGQTTK
jgi:hypothetical protein